MAMAVANERGGEGCLQQSLVGEESKGREGDRAIHDKSRKRVDSLDIFRGLTVALMILVDDAGGEWPVIAHAPWNGCNLADFVMPFFLFIVGMAIPLALKRVQSYQKAIKKVIFRTLKLLFWGILLQGGFSHAPDNLSYGVDMRRIRWCGILQRIALAYLVVSLLEITIKTCGMKAQSSRGCSIFRMYLWQWLAGACVLIVYMAVLYGTYVPDWEFTVHNRDDPQFGKHFKRHTDRLKHWILMGLSLLTLGLVLHFANAIPLNKQLYTFSYVCVTSGAAGLVFSFFYIAVDIIGFGYPFLPLKWIGMNAMLVYVMAAEGILAGFVNGWYYKDPHHTLVYWIQKHVFIQVWHSTKVGILLYVLFAEILFWVIVCGILHWLGIYWNL